MAHFLTDTCVDANVGYVLQAIFIIISAVLWSFYVIYLNRFLNKGKSRTSLDILYFGLISIFTLSECLRVIDPFSMNNILSFEINRLFFIFIPCCSLPIVAMLLFDTYFAIIYRIKKQLRPKKYRYMVLLNLVFIQLIPSLIMILSIIFISNETTVNTIFVVYIILNIIDKTTMILSQRFVISQIKSTQEYIQQQDDDDNDNNDQVDEDGQENENRQKEIMLNAEKRLISAMLRRMRALIVIIIYYIFELINGGIAINGKCYFLPGLAWSIFLRLASASTMFEAWIDFKDIVDGDIKPSFFRRMTTGAFINKMAAGVDLTRLKTITSLHQFELEPINQDSP